MNKNQIEELRKLKTLLNEEIITKEEFIRLRDSILNPYSETEYETNSDSVISDFSEDALVFQSDDIDIADADEDAAILSTYKKTDDETEKSELDNNQQVPAESKPKFDLSKNIVVVIILMIVLVGAMVEIINISKVKSATNNLPGEWVYAYSYTNDSDDSYDADIDSYFNFTEDGSVFIRIDQCTCEGKWSIYRSGGSLYIEITDATIEGESKYMKQITDNLSYEEYSDGANLYWYDWEGEHITDWHYYKRK